jgi:hypothetical protein
MQAGERKRCSSEYILEKVSDTSAIFTRMIQAFSLPSLSLALFLLLFKLSLSLSELQVVGNSRILSCWHISYIRKAERRKQFVVSRLLSLSLSLSLLIAGLLV